MINNMLDNDDIFKQALKDQEKQGKPFMALIEVTNRCNLRCKHCYIVEGRLRPTEKKELLRDEMLKLLEQLSDIGIFLLTFSGGEFFLHPHAFDYLDYATRLGFAIRIFSSLAGPAGKKTNRLIDYNVFEVETSIHGADAQTHDKFTGVKNSFDQMVASARALVDMGISVTMKTCWTRYNWYQYDQIMNLAQEVGADFRGAVYIQYRNDNTYDNTACRMRSDDLVKFFLESMKQADKNGIFAVTQFSGYDQPSYDSGVCGAGRTGVRIGSYGEVYPCVELQTSAGNIRNATFENIWYYAEIFKKLRRMKKKDMIYNDYTQYDINKLGPCAICPGANLKEKGDMSLVSEEAKRIARAYSEAESIYKGA